MPRDRQITLNRAEELFERMGVATRKVENTWGHRSENGVQYYWMSHKVDLSPFIACENPDLFAKGVRLSLQLVKTRGKRTLASISGIVAFISFIELGNGPPPYYVPGWGVPWALLLGISFTSMIALSWYVRVRSRIAGELGELHK